MEIKKQLFCIPYAGGTTEIFDEMARFFDESTEIVKLEYAGHGSRMKEAFYSDFQEMTDDMADKINALIRPKTQIAVFGYSMGSIVAYELLVQKKLSRKPSCMFFASHEAPDAEWDSKKYHAADDEGFFALIQNMGGLQKCDVKMLKNRFFRKMHYDPLRADYELLGHYKMSRKIQLDIPSLLFYSSKDIPAEKITGWKSFLGEKGEIAELGENHFFIRQYAAVVAEKIQNVMNMC